MKLKIFKDGLWLGWRSVVEPTKPKSSLKFLASIYNIEKKFGQANTETQAESL